MNINKYIDHTLLKPTATKNDILTLCSEAEKYSFYAVCVHGSYVKLASETLKNSDVKVAAVIGFPLGASSTDSKIFEAKDCIDNGASEIDMVINIGKFLDEDFNYVENEILSIKKAIGKHILKVIIETCYLTDKQIIKATNLVLNTGADFIKTSTGFGTAGAKLEHIKLMKSLAKSDLKIKASGGIKDYNNALEYIKLGASRLGTSSGVKLVTKGKIDSNTY